VILFSLITQKFAINCKLFNYIIKVIIIILDIIHCPLSYLKHNFSKTRLCLRSRDRDYLYLVCTTEEAPTEDGDRMQSPKRSVLKER
jgi:hypothetical protein